MFGLGMPEILLILAIALIVIGPKKLPDLAKTLGRAMGEFKRSAQDFKNSIDIETTVKDLEKPASDLKSVIKEDSKKEETDVELDIELEIESDHESDGESDDESDDESDIEPDDAQDTNNVNEPDTILENEKSTPGPREPDMDAPKDMENKNE
ncbi:MAG: twin-arginine translocase subunit TatB [Desulfobacula sp.]|nr:twin-arginine translocase subunit TatB [Desulfobacula sp.]